MRPSLTRPIAVASGACLALVALLTALVLARADPGGVESSADRAMAASPAWMVPASRALEAIGATVPCLALAAAIAALLAWRGRRWEAAWVVGAPLAALAVTGALKLLVDRPRPAGALVVEADPFAFPSGHAARAAALAVVLTVLVARLHAPRVWVVLVGALGALWSVAMAASRMVLQVHALFDVVAGLALGAGAALLSWLLLIRVEARAPPG